MEKYLMDKQGEAKERIELEECFMYEQGKAAKIKLRSRDIFFCQIPSKKCPYKCAVDLRSGGEVIGTICSAKGLVNKVEISPRYNLRIKKSEPKFDLTTLIPLPLEIK